ncbi:MAG: response regulator transcription factor [Bacteroidales bacterium]|nr:MAG: response regulator transcription factor [Bacteroidales bacterium]
MITLVIEDEKLAAERLIELVGKYDSRIEVIKVLDSVEKSVEWFNSNPHPDLVFMDIQLADGLSFEIFEKTEVQCPVIFTTAFDKYTIRAFKVNSVDYLLKPIDYEELAAAIEKFRLNFGPKAKQEFKPDIEIYDKLINQFVHPYKNRFVVKVGLHIRSIPVEEIDYFFVCEKSTFICTKEGKNYAIDYYLDRLEKLIDQQLFFRINRKFIININAVKDIIAWSNSRLKIVLNNPPDEEAIVSREKVRDFKMWLDR